MRVITGNLKGKRLKTLDGLDTRPTQDRIKEAIFSIIQFDLQSAAVIDLFAGSGQLGIEAMSRGAKQCIFVDKSKDACSVIKDNIDSCKLGSATKTINSDVLSYLRTAPKGFNIAFLDPPYEMGLVLKTLELLEPKLSEGGIVVCEHEAGLELPEVIGNLKIRRKYGYGKKVALTVYTYNTEGRDSDE